MPSGASLQRLCETGGPAKRRDLFAALADEGCAISPTSKPTHFKVTRAAVTVVVVIHRGEIGRVYLQRLLRDFAGE